MAKKAPRSRRPRVARRRVIRRARRTALNEFATIKQTLSLQNLAMNTVCRADDTNLSGFDRAVQVARAYQYFRITSVEWQFKPFMDTYTDGTVQSVPYFYYLPMKGDTINCGTFNQLRDAGCKPIRFDDKTIIRKMKPFVQQGVIGEDNTEGGNPQLTAWAMSRASPWLATSYLPVSETQQWAPSYVPHKGIIFGVQQDSSTVTQYYEVSVTVTFQFKKPNPMTPPGDFVAPVHVPVRDKELPVV